MRKIKKIFIWSLTGSAVLCLFLLILFFLSSRLLNNESIKSKILFTTSQALGGTLTFHRVNFNLFPQPNFAVHKASLSIPDNVTGTLKILKIYPKIIPLFKGRIQLKKIHFEQPVFNIRLPSQYHRVIEEKKPVSYNTVKDAVISALEYEVFKKPGLSIKIKNGQINLLDNARAVSSFSNIKAGLRKKMDDLHMDIRCNSDIVNEITLKWQVSSTDFKSRGEIILNKINPQVLLNYLLPNSKFRIENPDNHIYLNFKTTDNNMFLADINGNIKYLNL